MKPYYILSAGCNSRHLVDITVYDKLKDAINAIPFERAYILERHKPLNKYSTGKDIKVTTLSENII